MLIRFQMAKGSFTEMVRGSFQRQNLCVSGLGSEIIVDRIEIQTVGARITSRVIIPTSMILSHK
jgi:hypothetical protein